MTKTHLSRRYDYAMTGPTARRVLGASTIASFDPRIRPSQVRQGLAHALRSLFLALRGTL